MERLAAGQASRSISRCCDMTADIRCPTQASAVQGFLGRLMARITLFFNDFPLAAARSLSQWKIHIYQLVKRILRWPFRPLKSLNFPTILTRDLQEWKTLGIQGFKWRTAPP